MKLNRHVETLKPSPTLSLNAKAKALSAQGKSVVNLTTGEPDFPTPPRICRAAVQAMERGETKYTASSGIPELRKAIAELATREYGRTYTHENVTVTTGAKQALFNLCFALLNPGEEAIVFAPYWVSYTDMIEMVGGKAVVVKSEEERDFAPDLGTFEKALNPRTRAVVLNSPCNPTGAVFSRFLLKEMAEIVRKWPDVVVLSDDIYCKLVFDHVPFSSIGMFPELPEDQLVIVNGVSKTYSMTGWRVGYAVGPKKLISALEAITSQSTSNATSIAQWAALEAISGDQTDVVQMCEEFQSRRDFALEKLRAIPDLTCRKPGGAFYLFPNVGSFLGRRTPEGNILKSDEDIASYLIETYGVALIPGLAFGAEGFLRLSYGSPERTLEEGIDRIRKGLGGLR